MCKTLAFSIFSMIGKDMYPTIYAFELHIHVSIQKQSQNQNRAVVDTLHESRYIQNQNQNYFWSIKTTKFVNTSLRITRSLVHDMSWRLFQISMCLPLAEWWMSTLENLNPQTEMLESLCRTLKELALPFSESANFKISTVSFI